MATIVTVKATVQIPQVPNFLLRGDDPKMSIADVTDEGLQEIGHQWTRNLIARAQELRLQRKETPGD